jgi:3-deoxy-D-manno-octulosonic-acid transferase
MHILYNILATILVLVAMPVFVVRMLREEGFAERLRQSFGFLPPDSLKPVNGKQCIWLHAASVGEIVATSPIVKEIKKEIPDVPILISVVTETGYAMARRIIPEADTVIFFPLDLPWLCRRVVRRIRPRVFLPVETELWPNFLSATRRYGIPVMMVNGRISDRSVKNYHYLGRVLREMLDTVVTFCMQSTIDAQYIIRLGADPRRVVVTGNTKYDQTYTDVSAAEKQELQRQLCITGDDPVIVAGSTHKGEEELIFSAFTGVRQQYPGARLVVAPRDIQRAEEVLSLAAAGGFAAGKRTVLKVEPGEPDIVILDTIGELGRIYSLGDIIYVGGSLVKHGGHNILEPAAHGKPILVGPHMFNFKDIYALLSGRGACETVYDATELAAKILQILNDRTLRDQMGKQALDIIMENRGAARKSALYLKTLLTKCNLLNSK